MIIDHQIIAFAGIAALLTITPGQDTVLVIRNVMAQGQRAGLLNLLWNLSSRDDFQGTAWQRALEL